MTSPLHILLLEDDASDAELIQGLLEAGHIVCEVTRVQTRAEFIAGLENAGIDLILADYKLPSFDGLSALKLAMNERPDLPFIFVSGTLGEEVAIEAVKIGATDYVLKQRLSRLAPSVQRALRDARERAERKKAEEALRQSEMYLAEAQRLSHTGSFGWDLATGEIHWSDETYRIFECDPTTKPSVQMVVDRTHPADRTYVRQVIDRASTERSGFNAEHRLLMPNGAVKYVQAVAHRAAGEGPERACRETFGQYHRPKSLALRSRNATTGADRSERSHSRDGRYASRYGKPSWHFNPQRARPGTSSNDSGSCATAAGSSEPHAQWYRGDAGRER